MQSNAISLPEGSVTRTSVSLMAGSPAAEVGTSGAEVASWAVLPRALAQLSGALQVLLQSALREPSRGWPVTGGDLPPKLSKWVLPQGLRSGAHSWGASLGGLGCVSPGASACPLPKHRLPAFRASTPSLPGPLPGKLCKLRLFSPQSAVYFLWLGLFPGPSRERTKREKMQ